MATFHLKKRGDLFLSRASIYRFLLLIVFSITVLQQLKREDSILFAKTETSDEEMPVSSDDYDPVDYLPTGLPPSKNDPAEDYKSIK